MTQTSRGLSLVPLGIPSPRFGAPVADSAGELLRLELLERVRKSLELDRVRVPAPALPGLALLLSPPVALGDVFLEEEAAFGVPFLELGFVGSVHKLFFRDGL